MIRHPGQPIIPNKIQGKLSTECEECQDVFEKILNPRGPPGVRSWDTRVRRAPVSVYTRREAATTGTERRSRTAMTMETLHVSLVASRFGLVGIASSERGIVRLSFPLRGEGAFRRRLQREYPGSILLGGESRNREAVRQVSLYLEGRLEEFDLPLDLRGSPFRRRVLAAVRAIPYGETASYGDIARRAGAPGGARAAGQAVGANPIPLVIPCHRVIASNGSLGGFGLGLPMKRRLLALEGWAGRPATPPL